MKEDTFPKLLRKNYQLYDSRKVAMRKKALGIWRRYTWKDYYEKVRYFCLGLISIGMGRNDKVSIIGENEPELYWAELAVQAAGGVMVGIFADCTPPEVKYYVTDSDSKFVIARDQEQVDKILSIREELPLLQKVIYWEQKGLWNYKQDILLSFDQVLELGRVYENDHPDLFDRVIDQGSKEDIGVICYTSGTTGNPKGVMLSYEFLVSGALSLAELDGWKDKSYDYLSFISPAWFTEQLLGVGGHLVAGVRVNFPEKPETVQENIREVGPHLLFYGARLWENVSRTIQAQMLESTYLRRQAYKVSLNAGLKMAELSYKKLTPPLWWKIIYFFAFHGAIRPLRDRLGLSRTKVVYSAGGAISPDIIKYFKALDVHIKHCYSSTELGIVSVPQKNDIKAESSGVVVPWAKVKVSEDGEILVKSKYTYSGYYKNEAAAKANINKDGWYLTGDFGYIDQDGHLIVMDRMKDLKQLSADKKLSPLSIEVRLRISPYIKDVLVVVEKDQEFVGALINLDPENVGNFAQNNQIPYTTFTDLSQKLEVLALIKEEIKKTNHVLPEWSQVKRFVNLHKELDPDENELTRTRKLRRAYVEERYSTLINALFGDEKSMVVETPVTYRDGRSGTIRTEIFINSL